MDLQMGARDWLLLILLSLLWGGAFLCTEVALTGFGPFTVVLGRVGFAAVTLAAVIVVTGQPLPRAPAVFGAFLAMGLFNNAIPFSLIVGGQVHISGGLAAILNATTPLFSVVLAPLLTGEERLTPLRLAGVLTGIAGVAVLVGPDALAGLGPRALSQFAVLGAACLYACAAIYGRRFRGLPPLVVAAGQVTGSTLLILPVALFVETPWRLAPPAEAWIALLLLAVFGTALAYIVYFRILASAGATNLMLVTFFIPVSALAFGALLLGERLQWNAFAGLALIMAGLAAIDGRLPAWLAGRRRALPRGRAQVR